MHLGAARHLPIVAIFGSTTPNFGFAPYGVPNKICEIDLKCRPCTHIGKAKCPKNHFNCMKMISPTIVMNNVNELIYSNKISSKNKFLKV
ncbi:hypothetical protein SDC9_130359 [bioreactor metagenome]|uniref:ADP-heptose--LPS heptosyltransferase 2 n=1 Tax=bioreactor metagenome TaxID=1076179 RepID=A0A645D293_9ZZZZ